MGRSRRQISELRQALLEGISVPQKTDFVPDPFQKTAIEYIENGLDTLVVAPTGAGKTYIAVEGIRRVLESGRRAMYTAPLKALSNAKFSDFKRAFEPRYRVGLLTGDRKIEADADVVIATTEIYRNDLFSSRADYSLVVLDEIHYLADPQRGPVWEESIILSPSTATLLMLSASISNPEEVGQWISEVRGRPVQIVRVDQRPVELRYAALHPDLGIVPLTCDDALLPELLNVGKRAGRPSYPKRGRGFSRGRPKPRGPG